MATKVLDYFNGDTMSCDTWTSKYQLKDREGNPQEEIPTDMHKRLATEFGRIEWEYREKEVKAVVTDIHLGQNLSDFGAKLVDKRLHQTKEEIVDEVFSYFDKFKWIVPQGSIMANLGNKYVIGSLSNCFGISSPYDSYGGIHKTDEELTQLEKRRGGVGIPLDTLRPAGSAVSNPAKTSTGVVSFAQRYSNTSREVAQGGRRGALMLLLSCQHPEIFKFVTMKDDRTKVTGANVSVTFTDKFMKAVENDADFYCTFPTNLDNGWDYDFNKMSLQYNVLREVHVHGLHARAAGTDEIQVMRIHARELFDLVAEMAWKNGEPGVAFIDRIQDYSPDGVYEQYKPTVCNPCSEQWFAPYETCRLIAMNLFSVVDKPFTDEARIDWKKLYEVAYYQQRLGDDLVDLEIEHINTILAKIEEDIRKEILRKKLTEQEIRDLYRVEINLWTKIRKLALEGRRTGGGFTGLGDMFAGLGFKYGSKESIDIARAVAKIKMAAELDATIDMAILRGSFTGWNKDEEYPINGNRFGNSFYQMIRLEFPKQAKRMYQYGRRNVNFSTVSPTGTVSLMTQTTSGLEPLFKGYHIRRKKINHNDKDSRVDFIDQSGDEWQEYIVLHPKFKEWAKIYLTGNSNPAKEGLHINEINWSSFTKDQIEKLFRQSPWFGSEANDIDYKTRIEIQAAIQQYTSNAISATVNLPENVDKQVVRDIYMMAWKSGLKGVTVYRDGSRSGVLVSAEKKMSTIKVGGENGHVDTTEYTDGPKRPKELEADYYYAMSKGRKYAVIVGKLDDHPYEVFAFENPLKEEDIHGKIIKVKKGTYSFRSLHYDIDNLQLSSDHTDEKVLTRWTSQMLRHGVDPKYIAQQVEKSDVKITSFSKVITRILKKYISEEAACTGERCPECNESTMVYSEGCRHCSSCGYSKC